MTLAITGATGQLGRLVVQKLIDAVPADQLVGLARSPDKAGDLGINLREADYDRPETLAAALAGVDSLLLISGNELGKRASQHRNVLEAALQAGVSRVAYTSVLHADTSPLSLAAEHLETESLLRSMGIPHTILRNGWYFENFTGSIGAVLANGALIGSAGDGRYSSATREDYAEAAAAVLMGDGHLGRTYELAGDEAHTLSDLAAEISRQTGKEIPYRNLPEAEYAAALLAAGLPEAFAHGLASWEVDASTGALFDDGGQLSTLIGRPTTPLSSAVEDALRQVSDGSTS
jgi:NAD(P)H dehydrogenase (quinone)